MPRPSKAALEHWYENDIYIPTRTLWMGALEDDECATGCAMAESVVKGLHLLDSYKDSPITIMMNNEGGHEYHGYAIYDAIKLCKNHVTVKVYGSAMSMGGIILQAADHRAMTPNSTMMLHYGTAGEEAHSLNVVKVAKEVERCNEKMERILLDRIMAKHPKFTMDQLQEAISFDEYMTAEEAVSIGLADEVLDG